MLAGFLGGLGGRVLRGWGQSEAGVGEEAGERWCVVAVAQKGVGSSVRIGKTGGWSYSVGCDGRSAQSR